MTISGGRQLGSRWPNTMRALPQAEAGRGLDIFLALLDQGGAAHGAREIGPLHEHQRHHDLAEPLPDQRQQHQRDQDGRKDSMRSTRRMISVSTRPP